jgi:hypothetical protein
LLEQVQPGDLIRYGLIPEFVGRLPVAGVMNDLDKSALVRILTEPKNALLKQYQRLFEFENVRLRFTDDALDTVAELALQRKVGARGLRMILEDLMLEVMYHLPMQRKVRDFVVTEDMVRPARSIGVCLKRPDRPLRASAIQVGSLLRAHVVNSGANVQPRKTGNETRADDAGARYGHFPTADDAVHRGTRSQRSARSKRRWRATRRFSCPRSMMRRLMIRSPRRIYAVGTLANIVQSVKLPDGNIKVLVEGVERARALSIATEEGFFRATVRLLNARVEPSRRSNKRYRRLPGYTNSSSSCRRA